MDVFKQHLAEGRLAELPDQVLEETAARWEWFSLPRVLFAARRGTADLLLQFVTASRLPVQTISTTDAEALISVSPEELIDRFLTKPHQRIVAQQGEPDEEVRTAPELSDDDDLVSEELAGIYLKQGLREQAITTYRKLSLLNPEKSVYFAEIIRRIETNN